MTRICCLFWQSNSASALAPRLPLPALVSASMSSQKRASDAAATVSLVDKQFGDSKPARRSLRRQTTQQQVQKAISDNFKTFFSMEVDGIRHDQMTLRERLVQDKHDQRSGKSITTGAGYYRQLRDLYADTESLAKKLKVSNPDEEVGVRLTRSLTAWKAGNSNKGPITERLASEPTANQKELVGVLRMALQIRPTASMAQCNLVLDVMRFVVRTNLASVFAQEVEMLRTVWDDALCAAWGNMKKERFSPKTFVSVYGHILSLACDHNQVDAILAASGSWVSVKSELLAVTSNSKIGMKLCGFALQHLLTVELSQARRCTPPLPSPRPEASNPPMALGEGPALGDWSERIRSCEGPRQTPRAPIAIIAGGGWDCEKRLGSGPLRMLMRTEDWM